MIERCLEIERALTIADVDPNWILGLTYLGITTHYHVDDDGIIAIRMEGILENLPIFEQCAVIHEVDLFKEWVPFCRESIGIDRLGHAEIIAGFGADCLQEHGSIVIIGQSIDNWEGKSIPFRRKSWLHDTADIKDIAAIINILSPNTAKTIITAKNIAGVGLYLFQQQSYKVSKNPDCSHSHRIQQSTEFYLDWLYPKLRDYCNSKGWGAPVVAALGHTDNNTETIT
eukprot:gene18040-23682_t